MKGFRLILTGAVCVLAAALVVYAAANLVYNLPGERYPDPLEPMSYEGTPSEPSVESAQVEDTGDILNTDTASVTEASENATGTEPSETEADTDIPDGAVETETAVEAFEAAGPMPDLDSVAEPVTEDTGKVIDLPYSETVTERTEVIESTEVTEVPTQLPPDTEPASEPIEEPKNADLVALQIIGDTVKEAARLVSEAKIDGSFVSYPFEAPNSREGLTDTQKIIYDLIKNAVSKLEAMTFTSGEGSLYPDDDIKAAFEAFRRDETGMAYYVTLAGVSETDDSAPRLRYFLPSDPSVTVEGDRSALIRDIEVFEAVTDLIIEGMPEGLCTYDKYRYLASIVSLCTVYDHEHLLPMLHDTAYGPIMNGLAVCGGYTLAFEYLCRRADLYCTVTWGETYRGLVHMWNVVKLDTGTYHVDITWGDADRNTPCTKKWQTYFMITQEKALDDHVISDGTVATGSEIFN